MRIMFIVAASAVFLTALDAGQNQSFAKQRSDWVNGGYCPAGTCSKSGGNWARNVKGCSASNCRRK
jgi:hypothetical protein